MVKKDNIFAAYSRRLFAFGFAACLAAVGLFSSCGPSSDSFGKDHPIPEGMAYEIPLQEDAPAPGIEELKKITDDTVVDVLRIFYWDPCKADEIRNQSIANLIVNSVWGSGLGYIKKIQSVVGTKPDGIIGKFTLAAINNANQKELFDKLWNRRKKFFEDIVASSVAAYERKIGRKATEQELLKHTNKRFLKGWLNRLNSFKFE